MKAFYNEIEPYCCAWLQNLMDKGLITPGMICDTPIQNLTPEDVRGYDRCHFFAGIAGWEIALQIAGWPDDKPVWTGSCPCQPFSVAGKGKAQQDERHLWPHWFRLIAAIRPPVVFGEQVAGAIAHGWLDDAFDDLEREGYETGACVLPACSVGAPHKRDRLWFVGYSKHNGLPAATFTGSTFEASHDNTQRQDTASEPTGTGERGGSEIMADAAQQRRDGRGDERARRRDEPANGSDIMADTDDARPQRHGGLQECSCEQSAWASGGTVHPGWQSDTGICRISHGIQHRASKLRAYGNAIVPQVAAEFINAFMECAP